MSIIVVICTVPEEQSAIIAKKLLKEKLAACITLIPGAISYYFWQNKLECANEVQMLIKCDEIHQEPLLNFLKLIHPYEIPEILVIPIKYVDPIYLSWIKESLLKKTKL
ncbi:divalent cation tolerance protein CutA [Candidatus Pantoea edessiphila]|uniref:Divalent-cation tolerance protein CutA n=1 Tax=Candidatus Pantoea edessiphila TaxID=2044610 RepID=A0A2P5SW42_9GAMM|nr:divalent cation tolerance protein CutA [Candidatus Pantoea edessiphila]PPI86531.1 divalent-cation tolerance protein CutA [Candidatus Pantoea edessiphila]